MNVHTNGDNGASGFALAGTGPNIGSEYQGTFLQGGQIGFLPQCDEHNPFQGRGAKTINGGATITGQGDNWWGPGTLAKIYPGGFSVQWDQDWAVIVAGVLRSTLHISWDQCATWTTYDIGTSNDLQGGAWLQGAPA